MVPDNIHIAHPDKLFIGGAWVESTADRMIEIVSPNSEAVIARVVDGTEADEGDDGTDEHIRQYLLSGAECDERKSWFNKLDDKFW